LTSLKQVFSRFFNGLSLVFLGRMISENKNR
jgi:hypothetical protein